MFPRGGIVRVQAWVRRVAEFVLRDRGLQPGVGVGEPSGLAEELGSRGVEPEVGRECRVDRREVGRARHRSARRNAHRRHGLGHIVVRIERDQRDGAIGPGGRSRTDLPCQVASTAADRHPGVAHVVAVVRPVATRIADRGAIAVRVVRVQLGEGLDGRRMTHTGHDLPDRVVAVDGRRRILRAVRQTGVKEGDP